LADAGELLDRVLRRLEAIAPAVERPRAAERAVPRAAAAELDRGARVELPDVVAAAGPEEIARRQELGRGRDESRRRAAAGRGGAGVRAPGMRAAAPGWRAASRSGTIAASPSPRSTQSTAPSACARISRAVNEALCPPTTMNVRGARARVARARSRISGT